jgi:hypothetical protein
MGDTPKPKTDFDHWYETFRLERWFKHRKAEDPLTPSRYWLTGPHKEMMREAWEAAKLGPDALKEKP